MSVCSKRICLLISGCVKQCRTFPYGNSFFKIQTLTRDLRRTMSTWGQSEKAIDPGIHHIKTKIIQAPGRPPFLTLHYPPTLEVSIFPTKRSCFSQNCTQFDSFPSDILHNIGIFHMGLVHCNNLKPDLAQITQNNPIIFMSKSYKLKYVPFTTKWITTSSNMCGWTDALALTHPIVTTNG